MPHLTTVEQDFSRALEEFIEFVFKPEEKPMPLTDAELKDLERQYNDMETPIWPVAVAESGTGISLGSRRFEDIDVADEAMTLSELKAAEYCQKLLATVRPDASIPPMLITSLMDFLMEMLGDCFEQGVNEKRSAAKLRRPSLGMRVRLGRKMADEHFGGNYMNYIRHGGRRLVKDTLKKHAQTLSAEQAREFVSMAKTDYDAAV